MISLLLGCLLIPSVHASGTVNIQPKIYEKKLAVKASKFICNGGETLSACRARFKEQLKEKK